MVAITPKEAAQFLKSGFERYPVILFYGPDAGLVSERCEQLTAAITGGDRGNIIRIDGDDIANQPGRLADEAYAITMFGGRRAIWIRAGAKSFQAALKQLLLESPPDSTIVIEAGDLRKSSPLRNSIEKEPKAAALGCYAEDGREVVSLAEEMAATHQILLSPDAKTAIVSLLGADRKRSRSELEKLFLYCHGQERIEAADVDDCLTDAATLTTDQVIDAAFLGRL
ncbi:MAG: DNA polymerase III subunit delta, partial [Beijerinckiaceae bacterium]